MFISRNRTATIDAKVLHSFLLSALIAVVTLASACSNDSESEQPELDPTPSVSVPTSTNVPPTPTAITPDPTDEPDPTATVPPAQSTETVVSGPSTPELNGTTVGKFLDPSIFPGSMIHDGENLWLHFGGGDAFIGKISPNGESLGVFRGAREGVKGMAFDGTHIWTSDFLESEVRKLNLDGETVKLIPARNPRGLRYNGDSMWVSLDDQEWVLLSLEGQELARRTTPPGVPFEGSYWTISEDRASVLETTAEGTVLTSVALDGTSAQRGSGITVDGDVFWLSTGTDSTTRLDPRTGSQFTFVTGPRNDATWLDGSVPIGGGMIVTESTVWITTGSQNAGGAIMGFAKDGKEKGTFALETPPGDATAYGAGMLFFRVGGRIFAVREEELEAALTPPTIDDEVTGNPVDAFNGLTTRPFPNALHDESVALEANQVEKLWEEWLGDGVGGYVYADVTGDQFNPQHELRTDGDYTLTSTFYNCGDGGNVHGGYDPTSPGYGSARFWVQFEQDESGSWNDVQILIRDPRDKEAPPFFTARMWVDGANPVQSAGGSVPDFWIVVKELEEEVC